MKWDSSAHYNLESQVPVGHWDSQNVIIKIEGCFKWSWCPALLASTIRLNITHHVHAYASQRSVLYVNTLMASTSYVTATPQGEVVVATLEP